MADDLHKKSQPNSISRIEKTENCEHCGQQNLVTWLIPRDFEARFLTMIQKLAQSEEALDEQEQAFMDRMLNAFTSDSRKSIITIVPF